MQMYGTLKGFDSKGLKLMTSNFKSLERIIDHIKPLLYNIDCMYFAMPIDTDMYAHSCYGMYKESLLQVYTYHIISDDQ